MLEMAKPAATIAPRQAGKVWTLRGRMRAWFMLTSLGVFLLCYLLGVPFIDQAYQNVVATTLREEVEEFGILFEASDRSHGAAEKIYQELSQRHPELRMAFWVWATESKEPNGLVGDQVLIHNHPMVFPEQSGVQDLGEGIYVRFEPTSGGWTIGVVMDATNLSVVVQRFHYYAAVLAITAVAVGLVLE